MAGPTPQPAFPHTSTTPYGHAQAQPMPAYDPRMGKRPGGTATKVWGIVLLVLGVFAAINLVSSVVMTYGGFSGASWNPAMSPETKAEIDRLTNELMQQATARVTFWLHIVLECGIAVLSVVAGVFLVIKPKPLGARLGLARAALVLLALPVYVYETSESMAAALDSQQAIVRVEMEAQRKKTGTKGPDMDEFMQTMNPIMRGFTYGTMVLTVVFVLAINGLLAFQMTRPHIKEYLATVATEKNVIPGYDPSMGLLMPPPGAPAPGAMPPGPPPQQAPPGV
ncbi:MAG: hypothetical protein HS108_15055 [Planctomycetes bacterium]|jgi:hypothetical protein|nr:hypothetical protein [Planctomycetota bacterium]MCL4729146.1 hypothetical protein [Planctomycetota bacterium]